MKKIKKVYNTKLLYRWSWALWLTLLFILVAIAPIGVACLWQYASFGPEGALSTIKGYEFALTLFKKDSESITNLVGVINAFADTNPTQFKSIADVFNFIIKWVIPVVSIISAIFVVVLVIFFILGLFSGRFHHWRGPEIMAIWLFIFNIFYFGCIIAIMVFYDLNKAGTIFEGYKFNYLYPSIYLGVSLLSCIIIGIIYRCGFYGREFIPNQEYLDNFIQQQNHGIGRQISYNPQPIIINNNTTPAPTVSPTPVLANNPEVVQQPTAPAPVVTQQEPVVKEIVKTITKVNYVNKERIIHLTELPRDITHIGGHEYSKNVHLLSANIPEGVPSIGVSAFSNCVNLKVVQVPTSVKEIGYNAFFNCSSLEKIIYAGTKNQWRKIKRGSNWLNKAKTTMVSCADGPLSVNPYR